MMTTCPICHTPHPVVAPGGLPPAGYHEVRRDGRLIGWAPPGDRYPICAIILGPRIHGGEK